MGTADYRDKSIPLNLTVAAGSRAAGGDPASPQQLHVTMQREGEAPAEPNSRRQKWLGRSLALPRQATCDRPVAATDIFARIRRMGRILLCMLLWCAGCADQLLLYPSTSP